MQLLYDSDSYAVVQIELPDRADAKASTALPHGARTGGGYEIVDKRARREIFLQGLLAEQFRSGVQAIVDADPSPEAFDDFIGRYSGLAQQPLVLH